MKNKIITLVAAASVAAIATPAFSEEGRRHGPRHNMGEKFEEADTNKDGKLSFEEFKAKHDQKLEEKFKRADANNDGFVTKEELKAAKERHKDRRDKDDDNQD